MTYIKIGSASDKYPRKRPDTLVHTEQELREHRQGVEHAGHTSKHVTEEAQEMMAKMIERRKKDASRLKR